ncbi:MAG: carboxypeptidase-like regulatory domain-containing protein, partial [Marinilabilia sp.]
DNKTAVISGILLDQKTEEPLKYAQIVSYKEGVSHSIDNKGHFFFYLGRNDSVKIVSMGYEPVVMTTRDFLATKGPDSIFMKPTNYELNEVTVRARDQSVHLNLPDNIGKDVDPEAEPDRSIPVPSIGMISSPVTLAYSAFSRKAGNQRRAKKQMQKQKERALWENILHSGLLETWVELEEKELEDFIVFCNKRIQVSKEDTYLSIEKKVKNLLNIYQAKKE